MAAAKEGTRTGVGARTADDGEVGHPSGDDRFALIDKSLRRLRYAPDQLIEVLHVAQDVFGHLSEDVLVYLAHQLRLPPSRVYGVATFYHLFTFEAPGAHRCTVCMGTACFVKGAGDIVRAVEDAYSVQAGGTTDDRQLTFSTARCLGSCGLAPIAVLDGAVLGHQSPASLLDTLAGAIGSGDVHAPAGGAPPDPGGS